MSRFNSVLDRLKDRRNRAITGLYNCIPLAFSRFRQFLPGTEMAKYIIITANQKVKESNSLILLQL